jgi:hypothetical protein
MGHSAKYGLDLWATAQNFVKHCGPQRRICLESDTNQPPCIHMHVTVYPRVRGCISTCMWPCIHVLVAMYLCGHVSTCMWPCIHVRIYALWAIVQNLAQHCGPLQIISLRAMATAQNHWPQSRIIDHSAESQEIHRKACTTFKETVRQNIYIYELHYPRPIPSMLEILPSLEKKLILRCGPLRRMIF